MGRHDVVIVGAGVSGLCCANHLQEAGLAPLVLEASDDVGGRIRTDPVDGFLLDRGFQVLLTAYPEARRMLDLPALDPRPFEPGALIRFRGKFRRIADPRRRFLAGLGTVLSPVGTIRDKLRIRELSKTLRDSSVERILARPEWTTREALRTSFSDRIVERFFRPFLGGVFLESDLETSSRMFELVFRAFARGDAVLPARGMGEIPHQIAARLGENVIRTNAPVVEAEPGRVTLASGETIEAEAVVLATDGPAAARLHPEISLPTSRSVVCLYFAAESSPIQEPILVLDGEGRGLVNNLAVPSRVSPDYAPAGSELVSVSIIGPRTEGDAELEKAVRTQLTEWFGAEVKDWRLLRTYRIDHALPAQPPGVLDPPERPVCLDRDLFICGDHRENASIDGAMASGHRAAEALLASRD